MSVIESKVCLGLNKLNKAYHSPKHFFFEAKGKEDILAPWKRVVWAKDEMAMSKSMHLSWNIERCNANFYTS